MSLAFYAVYEALIGLSDLTGLSYEQVNVIVFYLVIPAIYLALIDRILRKPICTAAFMAILLVGYLRIPDIGLFADQLFDHSVQFLLWFSRFGVGYDTASVMICVILPILFFLFLCCFAFPSWSRRHMPTVVNFVSARSHRQ